MERLYEFNRIASHVISSPMFLSTKELANSLSSTIKLCHYLNCDHQCDLAVEYLTKLKTKPITCNPTSETYKDLVTRLNSFNDYLKELALSRLHTIDKYLECDNLSDTERLNLKVERLLVRGDCTDNVNAPAAVMLGYNLECYYSLLSNTNQFTPREIITHLEAMKAGVIAVVITHSVRDTHLKDTVSFLLKGFSGKPSKFIKEVDKAIKNIQQGNLNIPNSLIEPLQSLLTSR